MKEEVPSLWENKEFKAFVFIRFSIIFALFMQSTAIAYELYKITNRALYLGFIGLAEVVPLVVLALFAGHYVDKNEKRNILLVCMAMMIAVSFVLLGINIRVLDIQSKTTLYLGITYTCFAVMGATRAFIGPSTFALLGSLVRKENYAKSIPINTSAFQAGAVTGPLVGGLLLGWLGIEAVISISLFFLILSFISTWYISPKPVEKVVKKESTMTSLTEGLKFVFSNQIILAAMCLDMFAVLFGGAESLLPVYSKDILKVGEVGFGWLRSAHGIGSILMLLAIVKFPLKKNIGYKLMFCIAMFGVCIIFFGLSTSVYFSFFVLILGGAFDAVSMVVRQSILQYKTPEYLKGRVSAVNNIFVSTSNELGGFESTVMVEVMAKFAPAFILSRFHPAVLAVVFGGTMTIVVVLVVFVWARKLRTMKLE